MAAKTVMIGRDVAVTIAPVTIDAAGVITAGTAVALTGKAKTVRKRLRRETERVEAMDATIANNVYILDDWSLEIEALKYNNGATANQLEIDFLAGAYARVVVTTPLKAYTFTGILENFGVDFQRVGIMDSITLIPIDIGATNPSVA